MKDDWDVFVQRARRRAERHGRRAGREIREAVSESLPLADEETLERNERRRQRRSRRRQGELTPEERTYREAARRAENKLKFVQHLVPYVFVVALLAFVARPVAVIVALGWGVGLASHFFRAFVVPDLRKRWIRGEVDRKVSQTVSRERLEIEGRQLRSLEDLSASIAHEIRNPITAAKSLVQQMGEDPHSEENVEYAGVALDELDRVEKSISHLLRYAREEAVELRSMRLSETVDAALEVLSERIERLDVEIERSIDSDGEMDGDPEKLRRVFINLIGNALDVLEESKPEHPLLEIGLGENLAGTEIWARVKDNGSGMDEETQARVFQPFFTSKDSGTGLGLAITRKLVDAHAGSIELNSAPGQGTEFVLAFPKHTSIHGGNK
jgi:signal transduction histidine kinase